MKTRAVSKKKAKAMPKDLAINRRREWRFELPLSVVIEGKLPRGERFQEETVLENISSGGAYFSLDSGVVVGSKLNLVIGLPEKLAEGKPLKLRVGGVAVRLEKPTTRAKHQGVAVRFKRNFEVVSAPKKK